MASHDQYSQPHLIEEDLVVIFEFMFVVKIIDNSKTIILLSYIRVFYTISHSIKILIKFILPNLILSLLILFAYQMNSN